MYVCMYVCMYVSGAGAGAGDKSKGTDEAKQEMAGRGGAGGGEPETKRLGRLFAKAVPVPNQVCLAYIHAT